jgi:hypothetical protein
MNVQVPRSVAIEHFKSQILQLERKELSLKATSQDLHLAMMHFSEFIKNPSLTNAMKLAEGLKCMAGSQLHGIMLEQQFVAETRKGIQEQLRQAESPIHQGVLIPGNHKA